MKVDKNIFRAYDIRGVYPESINEEVMEKIGRAVGTFMKRKHLGSEILIGNDTRASSERLSKAFIEGICSTGINVIDVGTTSFGVALFSGWKIKKTVTAFITASHKPAEWNGIKFFDRNSVGFFDKDNFEIGKLVLEEDFRASGKKGLVKRVDMKEEYINHLKMKFKIENKIKVVVDGGNGCTSLVVPDLFNRFENIKTCKLFCNIDPTFSGRGSDVEDENLQELRIRVLYEKADFGFAFDGDGDRLAVVDDQGNILTPEQISLVLCKEIFSKNKGLVIANVESSMILEEEIEKLGGRVLRIPVGHSFMMREVIKNKAVFGMEASRHFVIPSYFPFDDAAVIALKLSEIVSRGKSLSELSRIKLYPHQRVEFKCDDETKFGVIENLKKSLSEKFEKVNTLDGIKVELAGGWVLIRASNTGPVIRLTIEAKTKEDLDRTKEIFSEILNEAIRGSNCVDLSGPPIKKDY